MRAVDPSRRLPASSAAAKDILRRRDDLRYVNLLLRRNDMVTLVGSQMGWSA